LQFGEFAEDWLSSSDDARDAACLWVVDNFDYLSDFIPESYPRILQEENTSGPLFYLSITLGLLVTLLILFAGFLTFRQRNQRVIRYAQIEFLWLLLAGLLMVAVGSVVIALSSTDGSCVAVIWLISLGYTLELVPLIVKVAAINRLMHAALVFRRIVLPRKSLFGAIFMISAIVTIFLILWTTMDPPHKKAQASLTDTLTEAGETVVMINYFCDSESKVWGYIAASWNFLLLICASILAFIMRNLRMDFNETQTLVMLIYSHFIFAFLRLITLFLIGSLSESVLTFSRSIIFSLDAAATLFIYFLPKFLASDVEGEAGVVEQMRSAIARRNPNVRGDHAISGTIDSSSSRTMTTVAQFRRSAQSRTQEMSDRSFKKEAESEEDPAKFAQRTRTVQLPSLEGDCRPQMPEADIELEPAMSCTGDDKVRCRHCGKWSEMQPLAVEDE
jgi:hypothetical protein